MRLLFLLKGREKKIYYFFSPASAIYPFLFFCPSFWDGSHVRWVDLNSAEQRNEQSLRGNSRIKKEGLLFRLKAWQGFLPAVNPACHHHFLLKLFIFPCKVPEMVYEILRLDGWITAKRQNQKCRDAEWTSKILLSNYYFLLLLGWTI